ncbi:MAG: hypothetical protein FH749_04520 [Firmicutes bacterium]|nr:hypothetical protein [Bacillota bacterium]
MSAALILTYLLIFIVILLLKRNIWAIINNYITRATGIRANWLAISLLITSLVAAILAALVVTTAVLDLPALNTLLRVLPLPIFLLWTALYVFLGLETYNMYWRIPMRRLLRRPAVWLLSLLMVAGTLILYHTLTVSPQLSGYTLAALNTITLTTLLLALGLLRIVRTAKWRTPPPQIPGLL